MTIFDPSSRSSRGTKNKSSTFVACHDSPEASTMKPPTAVNSNGKSGSIASVRHGTKSSRTHVMVAESKRIIRQDVDKNQLRRRLLGKYHRRTNALLMGDSIRLFADENTFNFNNLMTDVTVQSDSSFREHQPTKQHEDHTLQDLVLDDLFVPRSSPPLPIETDYQATAIQNEDFLVMLQTDVRSCNVDDASGSDDSFVRHIVPLTGVLCKSAQPSLITPSSSLNSCCSLDDDTMTSDIDMGITLPIHQDILFTNLDETKAVRKDSSATPLKPNKDIVSSSFLKQRYMISGREKSYLDENRMDIDCNASNYRSDCKKEQRVTFASTTATIEKPNRFMYSSVDTEASRNLVEDGCINLNITECGGNASTKYQVNDEETSFKVSNLSDSLPSSLFLILNSQCQMNFDFVEESRQQPALTSFEGVDEIQQHNICDSEIVTALESIDLGEAAGTPSPAQRYAAVC